MEVILREDVDKLGSRGQVVKVASGYARNFLLPRRMAVAATDSNKKIVEQERQGHLRREAKEQTDAADLAKLMGQVLWDDLNFEREFYMIPRDTYATIPTARTEKIGRASCRERV